MVRQVGCPVAMHLHEMVFITKKVLSNGSSNSSSFQLHHLKDTMLVNKKAKSDKDCLNIENIKFSVHDTTAEVYMIASVMTGDELGFTN